MSSRPELKLDWCSLKAAKYACEKWHYSRVLPAGKSNFIGVWEDGEFIGAVCFGCGSGNATNGKMYGLQLMQMAELTRVALREHKTPVSRIVAIALRLVVKRNPGLRLIVSYADPVRGHVGGIYQAGGWVYAGDSAKSKTYIGKDGREYHTRSTSITGRVKVFGKYQRCPRHEDMAGVRDNPGKYKYLMPLDDEMRERVEPLRRPYPKRVPEQGEG